MPKSASKPSPVKNISVCGISMKPQKNRKPLVRLDQSSKHAVSRNVFGEKTKINCTNDAQDLKKQHLGEKLVNQKDMQIQNKSTEKDSMHQERKNQTFQQNLNMNTSCHDSNQCMKSESNNLKKTFLVKGNDILNTVENENNFKMLNNMLTHIDINQTNMDVCLNQIPLTTSISHSKNETNDQNIDVSKIGLSDITMTYKNENDLPLDLSTHHVNTNQTNINEAECNYDIDSNLVFVINEEDGSIDVEDQNSIKLLTKSSKLVNELVLGSTIVNADDSMITEDSPDEGIELDRELVIDEELSNNENASAEEKDHREQKITVMKIPHVSSNVSYSQNIPDSTSLNSYSQSILVYAKKSTITDENILNDGKEDIELEHIGTSVSKAYFAKDIAFKKSVEGRNQRKLINAISKKKLVIDVNKKPTEISKRELNRIHCQAYRLKQKRKEKELIMERETLKQRNLELKNTHEKMKEELDKLKLIVSKILEKKND